MCIFVFYSFIENFGTHVITSVTIGGKDVVYVKQHQSSPLSTMEIKKYVQDIGNHRFSGTHSHTSSGQMKLKDKASSTKYLLPPPTPLHLHRLFDHQWLCFFLTDIYYFFILQGVDPGLFNSQGIYPQPIAAPYVTGREVCQILIIFIHRLTIACNILHLFSFLMIVCSFLMCFSI